MNRIKPFLRNKLQKSSAIGLAAVAAALLVIVAGHSVPVHADDVPADQAPLPIELPAPSFGGTPIDYVSEYLEEKVYTPRPPFLAPKGAVNLAAGKPVTSSCLSPTYGKLTQITDGEKSFQPDHCVELDPGVQWVQIDLGQESELYAVLVWHQHTRENVYFDVIVKSSLDPGFETGVQTLYNNDYDNSSGLGIGKDKEFYETNAGRLIDAKGVRGRYLRLYSNGNFLDERNHYVEVEAYGRPVTAR